LTDKKEGLELDAKTIKVCRRRHSPPTMGPILTCAVSRSMGSNPDTMPCSRPFSPVYVALGAVG
jgi:translation initiation factor 1